MPYEFTYTEGDRHPTGSIRTILADIRPLPIDVTDELLAAGSFMVREGEAVIDGQVVMLNPSEIQVQFSDGTFDHYYQALPLPDTYFGADEWDAVTALDEDSDGDEDDEWDDIAVDLDDEIPNDPISRFFREWAATFLDKPVSEIVRETRPRFNPVVLPAPSRIEKAQAALHAYGFSEWSTADILNTISASDPTLFVE